MNRRAGVGQVFVSFVCNYLLAMGVLYGLAALLRDSCSACVAPQRTLIGIAGATCIVFVRPALTGCDRDDAMFLGRLMGLALGVMTHLWLDALSV
ncbi:hypothetical protein [Caballeronia sp. INDeC2]|uniref:hypothetical protein n=1 Tax=Caballeronia sp. INDeC2 TaxID=2921747 RepID=UPI0020291A7F|nr:hypothetical protein [Caballeronia sp. INDeC2]